MKINIYSTRGNGGPRSWCNSLSNHLRIKGHQVRMINSFPEYFSQPFSNPLTHSVVPFLHPIRGKYILTIHGDFKKENNIWAKLYSIAVKQADIITVPSNFLRKELKLKRSVVLPNGIEKPMYIKNNYEQLSKVPKFGIITNFNFHQKSRGLIKLAHIIHRINPRAVLLVAGEGKYKPVYEKEIISLLPNAKFLGYVKKETLFSKIDIFSYYSFLDNAPLSVIEAMSSGLPVISNNIGAIDEILPNNLVVKKEEGYSSLLKSLSLSEKERSKAGKALKNLARGFYWSNIIEQWIDIYKE